MIQNFKSGFAAIIGMPNVGKSTLLNQIAGQKIAIISEKPHNKLDEFMVNVANESMKETDVLLFVVDASKKIHDTEREIAKNIDKTGLPCILVMNKIDEVRKEQLLPMIADYSSMHEFAAIVPISAKTGDGVDILLNNIKEYLEDGPQFYDEEMVTDQPEKQIAAEIIRTKMQEKDKITNIYATIYCEKASHKGIIIGKNGEMLKKIGSLARGDIEKMLEKKVYLELWVKIKTDWRNSDFLIKNFGYTQAE